MKSIESCQTASPAVNSPICCDICSAPVKALIRLVGHPGDQLPRACYRHLPRLWALMDLDAALDGIEVLA